MADIIREAPLGQMIRWVTGNKFLKYPEEEPDFQCPNCYRDPQSAESLSSIEEEKPDLILADSGVKKGAVGTDGDQQNASSPVKTADHLAELEHLHIHKTTVSVKSTVDRPGNLEKLHTQGTSFTIKSGTGIRPVVTRTKTREMTRAYTAERFDIEREEQALKELDIPIVAQKTEEGDVLVDWYTTDDPANPQNWSGKKKAFVGLQIL
jgi:MFS transporter, DHA1 family, multidrug resistance protein